MRITRYLWISNLPSSASEEDIRNALNSHGKIQNVRIHDAGQTRGAVVAFLDTKSATKAIESSVRINKTVLRLQYCESSGVPCCSSNTPKAASLQKPAQRSSSLSDSKSIGGEDIDTDSSSSSPYSSRSSSPQCGYSKKNQSYSPAKREHRKASMDSKRHSRRESRTSRSSNLRGLRITQLPLRSSDTNLREGLFHEYKKHGKITSIVVKGSGPSRSAHITFKLSEDAEKAYEHSKGKVFFGVAVRSELVDGLDLEDPDLCPPEHAMDEYHPKATKTLFVGNLCSASVTQEDLRRVFQIYGDIIEIDIKTQTNQPGTSYAFVQYCDIKSVVRALCDQENVRISGKQVKLGFGKSQPSNVVWLDNLSVSMTEAFLVRQFGRYGRLNHVVLDRKLLRALLYFDTIEAAQRALNETRNRTFIGKKVQIDYATYECQVAFMRKMAKGGGLNSFYGNYREKIQEILAACWPTYGNVFQIMEDGRSCAGSNTRRLKESISSVNISDGSLLTSRSRFSNSRSRHSNSRSGSKGKGSICSSRNSPTRDITNGSSSSGRGHLLPNPGLSTSVHYKQSVSNLPSAEPLGFDRRQASRINSSSRFNEFSRSGRKNRMSQGRKSNTTYPNDYSRTNGSYQPPSLTDYVSVDSSPTGPYPPRSRSRRKYCVTSSCSESSPERNGQLENWSSSKRRSSLHLAESDGTHATAKRHDEMQRKEAASQRSQRSLARHEKQRRTTNSGSCTPNPPDQPSSGDGNSKGSRALSDTPERQSHTGPPPQLAVDVTPAPEGASSLGGSVGRPLDPSVSNKQFVTKVPLLERPSLSTESKPVKEMETPAPPSRANQCSFKTTPSCLANFEALTELERERAELLRQLSLLKTGSIGSQPSDSVSQTFSNSEISSNSTERPSDPYSGLTSTYNGPTVAYSQPCVAGTMDAKDSLNVDRLPKRDFSVLYCSAASGSAGHSSSSDPGDVIFSPMGQSSEILSPLPQPPPISSASRDHTHANYSHSGKLSNTGCSPAIQAFAPTPASPPYGSIASPPSQWEHGTASTIESDLPMYSRTRLSSFDSALFKSNRDPRLSASAQQPQSASCTYRPLWIETSGKDGLQQTTGQTEKPLPSPQKPRSSVSETDNLSLSDSEQDSFLHTDATDSSLDERIRLLDVKLRHSEKLRPTVDYSKFRLRRKSGVFATHGASVDSVGPDKHMPSPLLSPPSPFHKVSSSIPPFVQSTSPISTSGGLSNRPADTSEFVKSMLSSKPPASTSHSEFSVPPSGSFQLSSNELPAVSTRSIETERPAFSAPTTVSQDPVLSHATTQPNVSTASPLPPRSSENSYIPTPPKTCVSTSAQSVSSVSTAASETPSSVATPLRTVLKPVTVNPLVKAKPTPKKEVPTAVAAKVQSNSKEAHGLHLKDFFTPQATQLIQTNKKADKKLCSGQSSGEIKPKERGPMASQVVSRDVGSLFMEMGSKRKLSTSTFTHPPKSPKLASLKPKPKELSDKVGVANASDKKEVTIPPDSRPVERPAIPPLKQKVKVTPALSKITKKASQMTPDTLGDAGEMSRKLSEKDNAPGRKDSSFLSSVSASRSKHSESQTAAHTSNAQTHLKGDSVKRRRLKKKKDSDEEDWKPLNSSTSNKDSSAFYFEEFGADGQYESMYDKIKRRANKDTVDGNSGTRSKPEALKSFLKSRKKAARSREKFGLDSGRDSDTDECLSEDVGSPASQDSSVQIQPCGSESVSKTHKRTCLISKTREHDPQQVDGESSSIKPTKVSGKKSRLKRPLSPEVGSSKRPSDMEASTETPKLGHKVGKLKRSTNSQKMTKDSRMSELIPKKAKPARDRKSTSISSNKRSRNAPALKRHVRQVFASSDSDTSSSQSKPGGGLRRAHTKNLSVSTTPSSSPHISRSCSPNEVAFTPSSPVGNIPSKGYQTPPANKELGEQKPDSRLTPEPFATKKVSDEEPPVQMTDANDEIPQLEKQTEDDMEPVRGSTLPPEDIDYCQSSELTADSAQTEPLLDLVGEQAPACNSSSEGHRATTNVAVFENLVDSPDVCSASVNDKAESLLQTASHLSASTTDIPDATSPPEEPPALFSTAETSADPGEEVSGLDILSNAATQSLLSERIFPPKRDQALPANSEPLTPRSLQFLAPVGQTVSVVAATAAAVPSGAPLVQAHPVLASAQSPGTPVQQHIALLLNPSSQTFSPITASKFNSACDASTTALNKPTFVLAAAPLSSRDVTLAPATMTATLSFVGPVSICQGVDKLIAGRPISELPTVSSGASDTISSSVQCVSSPGQPMTVTSVAPSLEPVSLCQVTENSDRSSYTSYVQRVIERVKQEKDEESMHSREKVKRTKKSVQKATTLICSGASTGILSPNSSVLSSVSRLNASEPLPSPTHPTVNCASPLQYSQIPPLVAKDVNCGSATEHSYGRRTRRLSQASSVSSETRELTKTDPYEPNFDEDFCQPTNQNSTRMSASNLGSRSFVADIHPPSPSDPLHVGPTRDSVDEVIDSVVQGEFSHEEYVQKVLSGTLAPSVSALTADGRCQPRSRANASSKASSTGTSRKSGVSPACSIQPSSLVDDRQHQQQQQQQRSLSPMASPNTGDGTRPPSVSTTGGQTSAPAGILSPLRVLTLVANTPTAATVNIAPKKDQYQQPSQASPRLVTPVVSVTAEQKPPPTAAAAAAATLLLNPALSSSQLAAAASMEPASYASSFAAQLANSYLSLLNQQQQQQQHCQQAAISPLHRRGDTGSGGGDLTGGVAKGLAAAAAAAAASLPARDVLDRSPHEAAEYFAAAATMAAMAVMQPGLGGAAASPRSDGAMRHVISSPTTNFATVISSTPPPSTLLPDTSRLRWPTSQLPEDKFPLQWSGFMALKNDKVYVQMHYLSGNRDLIRTCMSVIADRLQSVEDSLHPDGIHSIPILRITQRMRLENPQLEAVQAKLREPNSFCMCLALAGTPVSSEFMTEELTRNNVILQENFIMYMQEKVAAGIISCPPSQENPFVMHIFPPCDFSRTQLQQVAPELLRLLTQSAIPHMLIVVV